MSSSSPPAPKPNFSGQRSESGRTAPLPIPAARRPMASYRNLKSTGRSRTINGSVYSRHSTTIQKLKVRGDLTLNVYCAPGEDVDTILDAFHSDSDHQESPNESEPETQPPLYSRLKTRFRKLADKLKSRLSFKKKK